MAEERYYVGLTSGTSAEGAKAVLAAIADEQSDMKVRQVRYEFRPFEPQLRRRILAIAEDEPIAATDLALLDRDVGLAFAQAAESLLKASRLPRRKLAAIGSHGQTVVHVPKAAGTDEIGATLQIGSPAVIAERTGATVVADFRQGDVAAGGQGAPLAAWCDYMLFSGPRKCRVLVNIGGIANITFLPAGGLPADTLAFDAGPGNMVMDALMGRHFDRPYDTDGAVAASGQANEQLLTESMANEYFRRPPPKTCNRQQWGRVFVERLELMGQKYRLDGPGMVATACELTARTIVQAISKLTQNPHEVILSGGGARNITLAMRLRKLLLPAGTVAIERFDIDAAAKEALGFAMLAAARLAGIPANIPAATGAKHAALLGSITET